MSEKHTGPTPGPWSIFHESGSYHYVGGQPSGEGVAPEDGVGTLAYPDVARVIRQANGEANARLIAAAPALLEACKSAAEALCICYDVNDFPADGGTSQDAAINQCYAAITAATEPDKGEE